MQSGRFDRDHGRTGPLGPLLLYVANVACSGSDVSCYPLGRDSDQLLFGRGVSGGAASSGE